MNAAQSTGGSQRRTVTRPPPSARGPGTPRATRRPRCSCVAELVATQQARDPAQRLHVRAGRALRARSSRKKSRTGRPSSDSNSIGEARDARGDDELVDERRLARAGWRCRAPMPVLSTELALAHRRQDAVRRSAHRDLRRSGRPVPAGHRSSCGCPAGPSRGPRTAAQKATRRLQGLGRRSRKVNFQRRRTVAAPARQRRRGVPRTTASLAWS